MSEDHGHLTYQIDQLRKQLQREKDNNIERNQQLQEQLSYLSRDLDVLFASKTWRLGYDIMNLYRKVMNLFGRQHNGQYMNADHFKNLIESCDFYTHRKTRVHPTLKDTLDGRFPQNHYEHTQVEVVLNDVWHAQKLQKNDA